MKIGFYNPYLDGFGGGERYTLTLASHWSKNNDVSIFWDDFSIVKKSEDRFGLDLSRISVVPNIFSGKNALLKAIKTKEYDLIFFLSDGSIPFSLAKYNILHFQVPFSVVATTKLHMSRMNAIVCNSLFTKNNLDAKLRSKVTVIYPPVDRILKTSSTKKSKIILSIGRFTSVHTAKKQAELIDAFIAIESKLNGWRLVLAGGLLKSDQEYFDSLQKKIVGHAISLLPNISHAEILLLYKKASLYWHAAGFGENDPQFMEHFGISTVEAMSAGIIPIVYQGGGQVEIVRDNENGMLWNTLGELCDKTLRIIEDSALFTRLSSEALNSSHAYGRDVFTIAFDKLLDRICYKTI